MTKNTQQEELTLFRSLFKGREDVFAVRWEKESKSGYIAASLIRKLLNLKKTGRNTFGTERYFKLIEETESEVIIPKGIVGKLIRFCKEQNIEFEFQDERLKHKEIPFLFNTALREHQQSAIEATAKKD